MSSHQSISSPQQARVHELAQGAIAPRTGIAFTLEGPLDVARMRQGIVAAVNRHEVLRTRFITVPGLRTPVQEIMDPIDAAACPLRTSTLSTDVDAFARAAIGRADVDGMSALQVDLGRLASDRHVMVISAPNRCADLRSLWLLASELLATSDTPSGLGDDPIQYADYAAWRQQTFDEQSELGDEGRDYWRRHLDVQAIARRFPTHVATDRRTPMASAHVRARLTPSLRDALSRRAADEQVPVDVVYLVCWLLVLHELLRDDAGERLDQRLDTISLGIAMDGRGLAELSTAIGPYAQVVPLHAPINDSDLLSTLIERVSDTARRAATWQDYLRWPPAPDGHALFCPYGFSYVCEAVPAAMSAIASVWSEEWIDRHELQLRCSDRGELAYVFDPRAFSTAEVGAIARRWETVCAQVIHHPDATVGELLPSTVEQRRRATVAWNQTADRLAPRECVHRVFERQVEETPDAVAVVSDDRRLTFRELNRRANRLAGRLRRLGASRDVPVGLFLRRSVDACVGLLGILKAGAAFVPIDAERPVVERIRAILDDTGATLVVTEPALCRHVPRGLRPVLVQAAQDLERDDAGNLPIADDPGSLAYLLYTSGSTGRPKGVMVQHDSVVNLFHALREAIPLPKGSRVSLNAPLTFDGSLKQWIRLLEGATLHIIPDAIRQDGQRFVEHIAAREHTVLDCTPSHLGLLLEAGLLRSDNSLSCILIGGEPAATDIWQALQDAGGRVNAVNVYGPTECTGDSTACRIGPFEKERTIGTPLKNMTVHVVDDALDPLPACAAGELLIGGTGVARGYWRDPSRTAASFVPDPFAETPGSRLYRTRDRVLRRLDGAIEFICRRDRQVKIMGVRIELGEIEAALRSHPQVGDAVVVLMSGADRRQLVAYIRGIRGAPPSEDDLRAFAATRLPDVMLPSLFIPVDRLSRTAHGKIDVAALERQLEARVGAASEGRRPTTALELRLADLWKSVLKCADVRLDDKFFQAGGNSLSAMRLLLKIRSELHADIALTQLFRRPTFAALVSEVEAALADGPLEEIPSVPRGVLSFTALMTDGNRPNPE